MAPTPSTASSPSLDTSFKIKRRRNRVPLSCGSCRARKLRCDRSRPSCDNCQRRGDEASCAYAAPILKKKNIAFAHSPDEVQNRIDKLENLVLSLMTNGPASAGPRAAAAALEQTRSLPTGSISEESSAFPVETDDTLNEDEMEDDMQEDQDEDVDKISKSIGVMKVDSGKSIYISEEHWYSMLAEISEVKTFFHEHKKQYEETYKKISANKRSSGGNGNGIFFFAYPPATKNEILRSFPPKATTDLLISRFFELYNVDPSFQILHGPTYQMQYDQHWAAPHETDIMWLALSYSMMMIVLISYNRFGEEPQEYKGRTEQMYRDYKRLVGQSFMLIDVTYPTNYLLETLVLYVLADVGKSKDPDFNILTGVTLFVRLAMKMGYHRDSKHFPNIGPFEGEMRRRVWSMVQHSDLRISSQFGLPPVARSDMTNTEPPSNLYDDEISPDVEFLPPSRPATEATPISYTIYKTNLTLVAVEIVEEAQKLGKASYETVMSLDRKLRDVNDRIPPHLRMKPVDESIRDPSVLIMKRYILEIMYLRYLCLLHRKFSGCSRYPYSTRTCVESAMEILKYQRVLHAENRPGGRLSDAKMLFTSLSTQDFLLAAMIVCMDLYRGAEAERSGRSPMDQHEKYDRASMISAIEESLHFWEASKDDSIDAMKATGALTVMLAMLRDQESQRNQPGYGQSPADPEDVKIEIPPEHSAAMTLEMLSSGGAASQNGTAPHVFVATSGLDPVTISAATAVGSSMAATQPNFLQPAMPGLNGPAAAQSPFSSWLNNANSAFQPLDLSNDVDWDAIDSYITSGNPMLLEPGNGYGSTIWPVNFDPAMDPSAAAEPTSPESSMPLDPAVLAAQAPGGSGIGFGAGGFGGGANAGARGQGI